MYVQRGIGLAVCFANNISPYSALNDSPKPSEPSPQISAKPVPSNSPGDQDVVQPLCHATARGGKEAIHRGYWIFSLIHSCFHFYCCFSFWEVDFI